MLLTLLLLTGEGNAAKPITEISDVEKIIYQDKTVIDFEELEIDGHLVKPQGALLLERKKASFNPLIQLRTDFNREMSRSVDQIK